MHLCTRTYQGSSVPYFLLSLDSHTIYDADHRHTSCVEVYIFRFVRRRAFYKAPTERRVSQQLHRSPPFTPVHKMKKYLSFLLFFMIASNAMCSKMDVGLPTWTGCSSSYHGCKMGNFDSCDSCESLCVQAGHGLGETFHLELYRLRSNMCGEAQKCKTFYDACDKGSFEDCYACDKTCSKSTSVHHDTNFMKFVNDCKDKIRYLCTK